MDLSEMLFYYGIIGMVAVLILGIIVVLFMIRYKKVLQKRLIAEYGDFK